MERPPHPILSRRVNAPIIRQEATDAAHATTLTRTQTATSSGWERARAHVAKHAVPSADLALDPLLGGDRVLPLAVGLSEALQYHNRVQPWATRFVGLDNFAQALQNHDVQQALRTSLVMVVGIVGLSYLLGLVAGLLLNQKLRGRGVYRALLLVPWIAPRSSPTSAGNGCSTTTGND